MEKDGLKWFLAGRAGETETFMNNFKELESASEGLDNVGLFIDDRAVYITTIDEGGFRSCLMQFNQGIGSGGDFAMAALDFGKSAREAVEYAITKDFNSGGKVWVFDIDSNAFIED